MKWKPDSKILNKLLGKKESREKSSKVTSNKGSEKPEEVLENLEPVMEEAGILENEMEEKAEEFFDSCEDPESKSAKSMTKVMDKMRNESINFLKNISKELSSYSKEVARSWRDKHIEKKSAHFSEKLSNKKFNRYNNLWSNQASPTEELKKAKEKADRSFDSIYSNAQNLLKTIESDEWGHSKQKEKGFPMVQQFLQRLTEQATKLDRSEDIFKILEVFEKTVRLTKVDSPYDKLGSTIFQTRKYLEDKNLNHLDKERKTQEVVEETYRGDPFLICDHIKNGGNLNNEVKNGLVQDQIEKIKGRHPKGGTFPNNVNKTFTQGLNNFPEKYAIEAENRTYIFDALKNEYTKGFDIKKELIENTHYFPEELRTFTQGEVTKIIDKTYSYDFSGFEFQSFIASLPLQEDNYKKLYDKYNYYHPEIPYSKKVFLDYSKDTGRYGEGMQVPFFHHKDFDLSPDDRIEIFKKLVEGVGSSYSFKFLIKILSQFEEIFEGIEPEKVKLSMDHLIETGVRCSAEEFHILQTLSDQYNVAPEYREKFAEMFAKQSTESRFKELFGPESETTPTPEGKKLKAQPETMAKLELEFYERGNQTDLRHFFFEVLDGKRQAVDKDKLIASYAKKIWEIKPEEFIDIFVTGKKLDRKYAELFMPKIQNELEFLDQINEKLRLEQATREDFDWTMQTATKFGLTSLSILSLQQINEEGKLNNEQKAELFKEFMENSVNQLDKISAYTNKLSEFERKLDYKFINQMNDEDKSMFLKEFFNQLISHDGLHSLIINRTDYIKTAFPDPMEQKKYLDALLKSTNADFVSDILTQYMELNEYTKDGNIFSLIDENQRKEFLKHTTTFNNVRVGNIYMRFLNKMSEKERADFINTILSKEDILGKGNDKEITEFFLFTIQKDEEGLLNGNAKKIFSKIITSKNMKGGVLSSLGNHWASREYLIKNKDILKEYIDRCTNMSDLDTLSILKNFKPDGENRMVLDKDQVKALSVKHLNSNQIDLETYNLYLNSTPESHALYLDREIFHQNIQKIIDTPTSYLKTLPTIQFLILQRKSGEDRNDIITCNKEQEKSLYQKLFASSLTKEGYSALWGLDPELSKSELIENINKTNINTEGILNLLKTEKNEFDNTSSEIIDYCFDRVVNTQNILVPLCNRYKDNPELWKKIKDKVYEIEDANTRAPLKIALLREDLLEPDELKEIYEGVRSQENVRAQVLSSAEVFGSLASMDRLDSIRKFFTENSNEVENNMEDIVSFIKKYPLEKKGRTIAVMLFAQEYLPERKTEEIIEKVAGRLRKYDGVLEHFQYDGIPEGLRPSMGMEYEITGSTASGYNELTGRDLKSDIVRLSEAAHIGSGRDAVHEIATRPVTNPYLLLLEIQALNDIEYIDFNFDRSPEYQKGARGYHLTIGGEKGLNVNANTNFLQNSILAASWGGLHAGETGKRVSGGRGVTLRGRSLNDGNNIKIFDKKTPAVEFRALSNDKMEQFQRTIVTSYHGAIAIQALEKYTNITSDVLPKFLTEPKNEEEFINALKADAYIREDTEFSDPKIKKILFVWANLVNKIKSSTEYQNENFLQGETTGYMDDQEVWVDTNDFGGEYNRKRFESVVASIDPTLSVEEYVNSSKIPFNDLFSNFDQELADNFTKINNLYLKPSNKGDQANAIATLETTKLSNERLERRDESTYLSGTVFNTLGERREGYYNIQGASEKMITHAIQKALLEFNKEMEGIVNSRA